MRAAQTAKDEVKAVAADDAGGEGPCVDFVDMRDFTLADYLGFALDTRPEVHAAEWAVSNAVLQLVSVQSREYPFFDFSGGYDQATHNGTHFSWHQSGAARAAFSMDFLLYDFGRLEAEEREAVENIIKVQRDLADAQLTVFADVAKTYFQLKCADALLCVAVTNEQQYADHLRQAESLFEAGETKNLDVLKARLDLSNAHLDAITASNDVVTAAADFIRALGLKADCAERWDVMPPASDAFSDERAELPVTDYAAYEALLFARTNAPSILALRAQMRVRSCQVDYAVSDLLPSLSLNSGFSYVDPAWNFNWGVSTVQSLFEGFRKTAAVDQAVVALLSSRESVFKAEQQLSYDLSVAIATRDTARQALETARVQVRQARENLDNVVAQYRVGEASRIDFTDAASAFSEAEGVRVKAFFAGQIAEAELLRLMGSDIACDEEEESEEAAAKGAAQGKAAGDSEDAAGKNGKGKGTK